MHIAKPAPKASGSNEHSVWLETATLHVWDCMGRDAVGQTSPAVIDGMVSLSQVHRLQPPLLRLFATRGFRLGLSTRRDANLPFSLPGLSVISLIHECRAPLPEDSRTP